MTESINTRRDVERRKEKFTTTSYNDRELPIKKVTRMKKKWGPRKLRRRF